MTRAELADAMLRGVKAPDVEEWREGFINVNSRRGNCWVCALGSALVAVNGGNYKKADSAFEKLFVDNRDAHAGEEAMAQLLDIPVELAKAISERHFWQDESIEQIAAWLKEGD